MGKIEIDEEEFSRQLEGFKKAFDEWKEANKRLQEFRF